jgi:23S rRNA (pseudouridine1915-N3)-methyltransferase
VRIVLVCVGRLRGPPFGDDLKHYERLLRRYVRLDSHEVKEAGFDPARRGEAVEVESARVLKQVPDGAYVCALDREGNQLSSLGFADFIEERRQSARDLCFIVGGPFGLGTSVVSRADTRLSFGPMTVPHQLARVMLLEQLFRAHKILGREPYHY